MFFLKKEVSTEERRFLEECNTIQSSNLNMNFEELAQSYLNYQKDKVKITTYDILKKKIRYLSPINKVKLKDFNINHFDFWKKTINEKSYTTSYKNNIYKTLRAILNFAIIHYDINYLDNTLNKMTNFTNPNELKKEMSFFTYDEFLKFISKETDLKYKTFFELLYYCGLRKGEANALNWKDVDWKNKTISINKNVALKIKGKRYVTLPTKTKGSNRILPLPLVLFNDLLELNKYYSSFKNFEDSWFVFGGIFPLGDTSIAERKNKLCKEASIKEIRIHDFRHSCASLLINNGASITLVAKYLGHSNISTTLNTYSHMFKNQFEDIIRIMNNL